MSLISNYGAGGYGCQDLNRQDTCQRCETVVRLLRLYHVEVVLHVQLAVIL